MLHTPSCGAGNGTAVTGSGPRNIGAVLGLLRDAFPGTTVPKVRFLASEGLVEPQPPPSGCGAEAAGAARLVAGPGRPGPESCHLCTVEAAAGRAAGPVDQMVAPCGGTATRGPRAPAEATAREPAALSIRPHALLVRFAPRARPH
jgi:hypothetical protein